MTEIELDKVKHFKIWFYNERRIAYENTIKLLSLQITEVQKELVSALDEQFPGKHVTHIRYAETPGTFFLVFADEKTKETK